MSALDEGKNKFHGRRFDAGSSLSNVAATITIINHSRGGKHLEASRKNFSTGGYEQVYTPPLPLQALTILPESNVWRCSAAFPWLSWRVLPAFTNREGRLLPGLLIHHDAQLTKSFLRRNAG